MEDMKKDIIDSLKIKDIAQKYNVTGNYVSTLKYRLKKKGLLNRSIGE